MCIGDFNEILTQDEKKDGRRIPSKHMTKFREALEMNGLMDVGRTCQKYIWSNQHQDDTFTKEILDRAIVNQKWRETFEHQKVDVLSMSRSDNEPILLNSMMKEGVGQIKIKLFRYESKWT